MATSATQSPAIFLLHMMLPTCLWQLIWIKTDQFSCCFSKRWDPSTYRFSSVLQIRTNQQSITANLWPLTTHIYHVMIMMTGGFFNKSFLIIFRSSCTQMFFKAGVIRNFAIFIRKHWCWSLFLIKLQALRPGTFFQPCP